MRKNLEQRVVAIEKRCSFSKLNVESIICPHVLYVDEQPPCEECDHAQNTHEKICIQFVKPKRKRVV